MVGVAIQLRCTNDILGLVLAKKGTDSLAVRLIPTLGRPDDFFKNFYSCFLRMLAELFDIKYSYLIQIICTPLHVLGRFCSVVIAHA